MSNAYQQLVLDEESRKLTTTNTHKGLYQFRRLPLIIGVDDAEHNDNLSKYCIHLTRLDVGKCYFKRESVKYLGYRIDAQGLHPLEEKVQALVSAPQNVTELKPFLRMVQYYQKSLPNLATTLAPLYQLLQKAVPWAWTKKADQAFQKFKSHLASYQLLAHYDPNLPLHLACDASTYGVRAVLSHIMLDGSEKPVAYASHSLATAEEKLLPT